MLLVPSLVSDATRGVCSGGIGIFCNPTVPTFNSHIAVERPEGGDPGPDHGGRHGHQCRPERLRQHRQRKRPHHRHREHAGGVVHAVRELGESETGGASINIVPRTGGNRFAGNYFTSYLQTRFFDRNRGTRLTENADDPGVVQLRLRRQRRVWRADSEGPVLVLRIRGSPRRRPVSSGRLNAWIFKQERGQVGRELRARSYQRVADVPQRVQEGQRSPDAAGDAEEQVQHLLGRAVLLHEPLLRHDQRGRLARGVRLAAVVSKSADAVVVDQPVHEPDAVRSGPELHLDARGLHEAPGVQQPAHDSPCLRNGADRRTR